MKKVIVIDGMSCRHCQAAVENALNAINGVQSKVDLKKKQAVVTLKHDMPDQVFSDAVRNAGYEVISISEKKGLFGG